MSDNETTDRIEAVARVIYYTRTTLPWHLAPEETRKQAMKDAQRAIDAYEIVMQQDRSGQWSDPVGIIDNAG